MPGPNTIIAIMINGIIIVIIILATNADNHPRRARLQKALPEQGIAVTDQACSETMCSIKAVLRQHPCPGPVGSWGSTKNALVATTIWMDKRPAGAVAPQPTGHTPRPHAPPSSPTSTCAVLVVPRRRLRRSGGRSRGGGSSGCCWLTMARLGPGFVGLGF